jgi:microcystin-dependent protein
MDAFVGEIRLFPYNFVPANWFACDGSLLAINQYSTLFAILGAQYGGNGTTNFALPNLNGRVAMHRGMGPGLTMRSQGEQLGADTVLLNSSHLASHTHSIILKNGVDGSAALDKPNNTVYLSQPRTVLLYNPVRSANNYTFAPATIEVAGNANPVPTPRANMQPYLTLTYAICAFGDWPERPD